MEPRKIKLVQFAYWLIRLRWLGVLGIVLVTFFSSRILDISVEETSLYVISAGFLLLNVFHFILLRRIVARNTEYLLRRVKKLINFQISSDLFVLTLMLHFSGGIENPFIIYYIFHMIMASIILSPKESFLQVTFALILIGLLTISEYSGIIPHYPLEGFVTHNLYTTEIYLIGTGIIFITTSYLVVYITNSIAVQSRKHEEAYIQANRELEKKDNIKNEYVLRITHDIKGHLAAIQSCLGVANKKIKDFPAGDCPEFVERAYKRTNILVRFIKDLLYITKMKLHDQFEKSGFSIRESVKRIVEDLKSYAEQKSIEIKINIDDSVDQICGFQVSIEELISNLLTNAIHYSERNGKVLFNVGPLDNKVLFEVIDEGIGIPVDEQDLIFDEFYRASNIREKDLDGTGLGLSISKKIVENHGGEIWVESQVGSGTKFSFTIPGCLSLQNKT